MKIACVGGGPAGLYFAILLKRQDPSQDITVYERDPEGSTYGWGVTYWDDLYHSLHALDPESAAAIGESSIRWDTWAAHIADRPRVRIDYWDGGFGIGRARLLGILADRARSLGVTLEYEREIAREEELAGADLIVAGDGVNSGLRERHAGHFGTRVATGRNLYLWLGTTKVFESFTFAFATTPHGWIWCYGYGYSPDHSTCVIECAPETWAGLGFDRANEADSLALLEKLFADILDGHPLISRPDTAPPSPDTAPPRPGRAGAGLTAAGRAGAGEAGAGRPEAGLPGESGGARWLNFRTLTNERWHRGNLVLVGDAAHTTHYSVGAGTALALGDASFLVHALTTQPTLERALAYYGRERRRTIRRAQKAARNSARWYESLPRYLELPSYQVLDLLGLRHSSLLPHVPPRLYHRLDQVAGQLSWLWSVIARRGGPPQQDGGPRP
ncbi:FAD-dependent monooxygenase [Nonomuraea candida]|uniref:FAD-dependent monooxygenase n=1 Tax=Nonomuraea candida TaxID=359159 RepID=UPI0005B7CD78|nr:FAD-dependent monooxygenase [Nonomuraea candida]